MVTDPISDLLVRLQNGFRRRHDVVSVPASRLKREVLRILQNEGYIQGVQADVAALDLTRPDLPSIGVSGDIRVRPEQRKAFLEELQQTLQDLFTRYGGAEGDAAATAPVSVARVMAWMAEKRTAVNNDLADRSPHPRRGRADHGSHLVAVRR